MYSIYRQNTHGILLQNISTGLGVFWDDFEEQNSAWDLDPPTHFHSNLGFKKKILCKAPNPYTCYNIMQYI